MSIQPTSALSRIDTPIRRVLPPVDEIAFYAWSLDGTEPDSLEELFAVNPRTAVVRRLTNDPAAGTPASDRDPDWSPTRTRLVSMRADGVNPPHLVVRDLSGAPVLDLAVAGAEPTWMDARRLLCGFSRTDAGGQNDRSDIVTVALRGGATRSVTAAAPGEYFSAPAWHPTAGLLMCFTWEDPVTRESLGSRIVHAGVAPVAGALTSGVGLTSSDLTMLTRGTTWDQSPAWSPDGATVAFSTLRPCATIEDGHPLRQREIALVSLTSPRRIRLVTNDVSGDYAEGIDDGSPAFSPDGKWLAWSRGYEDSWSELVIQRVGYPASRHAVLPDHHYWRGGLDW